MAVPSSQQQEIGDQRRSRANRGQSLKSNPSFDSRGRITASEQRTITSGTTQTAYPFAYTYNRDGTLATQTYPSGKVVSFAYDRGGRPVNVAELSGPLTTYVSSVVYADHGAPASIVLGNTLTEQSCYSTRDQLTTRRLGTGTQTNCAAAGGDLLRLAFAYATPTTDNGNLTSQTITAPSFSQTQYYGYDGVNRLKAASEGAALTGGGTTCPTTQSWCREYGFDPFGNRWVGFSNRTLHMATPTSAAAINGSTNRLTGTGITYDNDGNLTAHPFITPGGGGMVYNASNKMTQFTATGVSVAYRYDAKERRVRQDSGGETTIWVYDAAGQLAAEYATNLTMVQGIYYRTTDRLGSTRVVTNQSAAVVQRRDFFPFGEKSGEKSRDRLDLIVRA
jgi:YD repeat-containing protein